MHAPSRNSPPLCIFDDGRGRFGPLTDRRAAFSLRTGVYTNRVRIELALGHMASSLRVDPRLAEAYRAHETDALVNEPLRRAAPITFCIRQHERWQPATAAGDADVLLVNGRWTGAPPVDAEQVAQLRRGQAIVQSDGQTVATLLGVDEAQAFIDGGFSVLPPSVDRHALDTRVLLERPWDILDRLEGVLRVDLEAVATPVAASARVHAMAVLDGSKGPVALGDEVTVGPFAVIEGPCSIGRRSVVQPHSHIRPFTVVGEDCKVSGEISASILHDHTNKAHFGYLGNSIVGEWVNLGAGTTVSNLKNTFGEVRMQLDADTPPEPTGRRFLGPVIGDFVRTAIGTRIPTGSCVGTASMLAISGFSPKFVPRGRFITDDGDAAGDPGKFIATAQQMFARRGLELSAVEERMLRELLGRP